MQKFNRLKTALIFIFLVTFSCKKEDPFVNTTASYNSDGSPKRKVSGDVRDSVFYYAETAYLWYNNLPTAAKFLPLNFSGPGAVIEAVRGYSEKSAAGKNRDIWSFVMDKTEWNNLGSGNSKNFGAYYRFAANGDFFIRQVFSNSDMGRQGVKRGWKVISFGGLTPQNNETFINSFLAALNQNTLEIKFELPDKSQKTLNLTQKDYITDTIQSIKVFDEGSKKIGYFCFTDFLGDDTSKQLENLFADFKSKGVNELVIDLRYNGGGYVNLATQLINHIAPQSAAGKVMFTYQYNDKLKSINTSTKITPTTNLGLSKIVVITTKNSASASELLINSLKPHMDVKIVGSASHGKPVGFPIIPLAKYIVAPVAFKTVNSAGQADYYEGFKPDYPEADDLTKNFGDPTELCLKVALEYLKTGKVITNSTKNARVLASNNMEVTNIKLPKTFEGMYVTDTRVNEAILKLK